MIRQYLNLTNAEYDSITAITEQVKGMSVMSAMDVYAELVPVKNEVAALNERQKYVPQGRLERKPVYVPVDVVDRLLIIADNIYENNTTLWYLLHHPVIAPVGTFIPPVYFVGNMRVTGFIPKAVAKGSFLSVQMDALAPSKEVKVRLLKPDNTLVQEKTLNSDIDGRAVETMTVPADYVGNKIKLNISQVLVAATETQEEIKFEQEDTITVTV